MNNDASPPKLRGRAGAASSPRSGNNDSTPKLERYVSSSDFDQSGGGGGGGAGAAANRLSPGSPPSPRLSMRTRPVSLSPNDSLPAPFVSAYAEALLFAASPQADCGAAQDEWRPSRRPRRPATRRCCRTCSRCCTGWLTPGLTHKLLTEPRLERLASVVLAARPLRSVRVVWSPWMHRALSTRAWAGARQALRRSVGAGA